MTTSNNSSNHKFTIGRFAIVVFSVLALTALIFVATDFNISKTATVSSMVPRSSLMKDHHPVVSSNNNNHYESNSENDQSSQQILQETTTPPPPSSTTTKMPSTTTTTIPPTTAQTRGPTSKLPSPPSPQPQHNTDSFEDTFVLTTTTTEAPPPPPPFELPLQPESEMYRKPIENGKFGKDPGAIVPCLMIHEHINRFNKDPKKKYAIHDQIPHNQILKTHLQDGQFCFPSWFVQNVVLQIQPAGYDLTMPVLHVPSKKYVGSDIHFHNFELVNTVNSRNWRAWRNQFVAETEPIRYIWYKRFRETSCNGGDLVTEVGARGGKFIPDDIVREGIEMATEMKRQSDLTSTTPPPKTAKPTINPNATTTTTFPPTTTTTTKPPTTQAPPPLPIEQTQLKEDVMMDYLYNGLHNDETGWKVADSKSKPPKLPPILENVSSPVKAPPSVPRILPVRTEFAHAMQVDNIGAMPAVTVARLLSAWGSFYSSGLQALGPKKITLLVNKMNYGHAAAKLTESFSRHFPVPAMYFPQKVTFYVKQITFSMRQQVDVVDPCAFHFIRNWLLPSVVNRIKFAMRNGRDANIAYPSKYSEKDPMWKEIAYSPHDNVEKIEDAPNGIYIRHPVPPEQEVPWWPKEYDELIRNPPENIFFFKNPKTAYSGFRAYPKTEYFTNLMEETNFAIVSDSSPHDVRMYLVNHAKRVVTMWGGGNTMLSYLWAGGVEKVPKVSNSSNEEDESKIRNLDIIILIHPGYYFEMNGLYFNPLRKQKGVNLTKREYLQQNLTTYLCPPSPEDHWSEAAQASRYAWSKMIKLDNIDKLRRHHLFITDEEKSKDLGPLCKEMNVEKKLGPRWKSKWES